MGDFKAHLLCVAPHLSQDPPFTLSFQGSQENLLGLSQGYYHFFLSVGTDVFPMFWAIICSHLTFGKPRGSRLLLWVISVNYCSATVAHDNEYFSPYARGSFGVALLQATVLPITQGSSTSLSLSRAHVTFFLRAMTDVQDSKLTSTSIQPLLMSYPLIPHLPKQVK